MASESYWTYKIAATGTARDVLLYQLDAFPFNGFMEEKDELLAYLPYSDASSEVVEQIALLLDDHEVVWSKETLVGQNWNEQWEASFKAVQVGNFVGVRAEFHPPFDEVEHELLIHPRMAFGTGHHATTYLVMERMGELECSGKSIFDYGCGTGILAILAKKLGAKTIDAVDIEVAATENTLVNINANNVDGIDVYTGRIDAVPAAKYDLILANINRRVILESLGALYEKCNAGGDLLVSGILERDQEIVESEAQKQGWTKVLQRERNGWLLMHYRQA